MGVHSLYVTRHKTRTRYSFLGCSRIHTQPIGRVGTPLQLGTANLLWAAQSPARQGIVQLSIQDCTSIFSVDQSEAKQRKLGQGTGVIGDLNISVGQSNAKRSQLGPKGLTSSVKRLPCTQEANRF